MKINGQRVVPEYAIGVRVKVLSQGQFGTVLDMRPSRTSPLTTAYRVELEDGSLWWYNEPDMLLVGDSQEGGE